MIEHAIKLLRKYESGLMTPKEAREFLVYAVNSGLVWCTPGICGIASAIQYGKDGGRKC